MNAAPTEADVKPAFELLAAALEGKQLNTEQGEPRVASAEEFMLMSKGHGLYHFKHSFTRNYVLVSIGNGQLIVPSTGKPFQRGTFDVYPD